MKRILKRKLAAVCLGLLVYVLLNYKMREPNLSFNEHSAVSDGGDAATRVGPSRFAFSIGVCFQGHRRAVRQPRVFNFYRARCDKTDGWFHMSGSRSQTWRQRLDTVLCHVSELPDKDTRRYQ